MNRSSDVRDVQWGDLAKKPSTDRLKKHYVYGELESRTLDFTTRADISFTPILNLQFCVQPFVMIGSYTNFKELMGRPIGSNRIRCKLDTALSGSYNRTDSFVQWLDCSFLIGIAFTQLLLRALGNFN